MKNNPKKTILLYCDFGCTTGFGIVAKGLIDKLKVAYKQHVFLVYALNNFEEKQYDYADNVIVYPAHLYEDKTKGHDPYHRLSLLKFLSEHNIDLFWMINDIEVATTLHTHLKNVKDDKKKHNRRNFKSMLYFPVDSTPRKDTIDCLQFFDEIVTYTDYGKTMMGSLIENEVHEKIFKRLRVINHGVDNKVYYPLAAEEKKSDRESLFPGKEFIIGTINRNSTRKDVATLILAYSKFLKSTRAENTMLYLHMNPIDPAGTNLFNLCKRLGLVHDQNVFLIGDFNENRGWPEEVMNSIYNSFDLFVTTTTAEGWGLTITEAMAAGVPVMCPLHTSLTEISDEGRHVIPIRNTHECVFVGEDEKIRYKSNPDDVAFLLETFYNNKMHKPMEHEYNVENITASALKYVSSLTWTKIAGEFRMILNKYL